MATKNYLKDYVALLCQKGGTKVKAVKMSAFNSKYDRSFRDALKSRYPDWNVKQVLRLYPDDFTDGGEAHDG